jgi:TonB family protein
MFCRNSLHCPAAGDSAGVGGQIRAPTKIKDVKPVYPAIAQSARVAGVVTVEATIGPDGKVIDARVVRSIPLLDQAALDAVRQWEYPADAPERRTGAGSRDRHDQLHSVVGICTVGGLEPSEGCRIASDAGPRVALCSVGQRRRESKRKDLTMLWTLSVILIVLWLLGLVSSYTIGGYIHVLLVVAIIVVLVRVIQGRRQIL